LQCLLVGKPFSLFSLPKSYHGTSSSFLQLFTCQAPCFGMCMTVRQFARSKRDIAVAGRKICGKIVCEGGRRFSWG